MLEIRPTRPEDLPALGELFADRFGHSLSPEDWTWKYRQIPDTARSLVAIETGEPAVGAARVVAHAGALRLPARYPGGDGGLWHMVDFAGTTRRRGLRAALVDLGLKLFAALPGEEDAPWIFGFPSERHYRLGERVFGYHPLPPIEPLAGELPTGGTKPEPAVLQISDSCLDWADRVETVWERCGGIGVRRSAAFLSWRYTARPNRYYRFYRMAADGAEGLAVFAFGGREACAAEMWLPPLGAGGGVGWYSSLLAVAADLRAAGFSFWRFWPGPGLDPGLGAALGLRPTGERQIIGSRGRPGGAAPAVVSAGFSYAMGDYDVV